MRPTQRTTLLSRIGAQACLARKAVWLLALVLVSALPGCAREDAETALRRQVAVALTALDEREHGVLVDMLTDAFAGPEGMDRESASRMLRMYFLRYRDVSAVAGPLHVELVGERARVRFSVLLSGGSGGLLPESARAWEVESGWLRVGGDWRLIALDWRPVGSG